MKKKEKSIHELVDGDEFMYDGTTYVLKEDREFVGCGCLRCDFSDLMLDCVKLQQAGKIPYCAIGDREDGVSYVFIEK